MEGRERERAQNWVPGVDEHQFPARFSAWLKDDSWEQLFLLDADPHPGSQVAVSETLFLVDRPQVKAPRLSKKLLEGLSSQALQ